MSEGADEEPALAQLLARLTRPGMVDVGRIRGDFARLSTPGLGLGASATTRRIAARGADTAVPVVSGEMVYAASPDAATEPAPTDASPGAAPAAPAGQIAAPPEARSRIEATVRAAASQAVPAAARPIAAVAAQPDDPAAEITAALDLVAPISVLQSAPAAVPIGAGAPAASPTITGNSLIVIGQPAHDIAADPAEPMIIDRPGAAQPAATDILPNQRDGARDPAATAYSASPAMRAGGAAAAAAPAVATAPAAASRAPDIAAIADLVRHELLRDLAVEAERRGGQRWRK